MCDCIDTLNEKVLAKMKEDKKGIGIVNEGSLQNMGLSFSGGGWRTYNPFKYEMTNKKKDGSLGATRNYEVSIYHSYCPFCGEKYPKTK
jgi:hypothetical protein